MTYLISLPLFSRRSVVMVSGQKNPKSPVTVTVCVDMMSHWSLCCVQSRSVCLHEEQTVMISYLTSDWSRCYSLNILLLWKRLMVKFQPRRVVKRSFFFTSWWLRRSWRQLMACDSSLNKPFLSTRDLSALQTWKLLEKKSFCVCVCVNFNTLLMFLLKCETNSSAALLVW